MPIAGSGMKLKILEAFALGTPVVTTPEGVEGILLKMEFTLGFARMIRA